jgi:hypothetical protein
MIRLASVIESTYAPYSNICPISGWTGAKVTRTGKNWWDEEWELGEFNTNTGATYPSTTRIRSKNFIPVLHNTTYYIKCSVNGQLLQYDKNKNFIALGITAFSANGTFTTASNAYYVKFSPAPTYGTTYNHDISINYPATDTEYHAYQGQTYDIAFPSEAGTVFGGTLDVTSGVLTVDRVCHTYEGGLDDVIIAKSIQTDPNTGEKWLVIRSKYNHAVTDNWGNSVGIIKPMCSCLGIIYFGGISNANVQNVFAPQGNWAPASVLKIEGLTTETDYDAWCAEHKPQISWLLANAVTFQLTPQEVRTLLGQNNIWADTGDVSLLCPADTKAYIDNQIASTRKLIAGIETGFTASKAYSVGDMLIIGNDLYKVSASIASGATITVGTNVTKTTVAEQLIALANA